MTNAFERLIAELRHSFPVTKQMIYTDLSGRAPLATFVQDAVYEHILDGVHGNIDKDLLFERVEESRSLFGRLINADPDEISFTKNTSEGLNAIATSIEWKPGDNILLCPELEHPNNVYPWLNLKRLGVEPRFIPHDRGCIPVDALIDAIDQNTRLVTVSAVTFSPGYRTDLKKLGLACRQRDVILLVDAAQSAGVLHTDVRTLNIDALAASTQKGLLALYGMGFLYVRNELASKLSPAGLARFGVKVGDTNAHESDYGGDHWHLQTGARRFDLGNYNYTGIYAANAALRFLLGIGTECIEQHACGLASMLASALYERGLPISGGIPDRRLAHIVTLGEFESGASAYGGSPDLLGLYEYLQKNKVKLSMRRGTLRFSFHIYNDANEVNRIVSLVEAWQRSRVTPVAAASASPSTTCVDASSLCRKNPC